jgi:hypothetical protein
MQRKDNDYRQFGGAVTGNWKGKPEPLSIDRKERPICGVSNVRTIKERRKIPAISTGTNAYICADASLSLLR